MKSLIEPTERGLYCAAGDFYIDPWKPVDRAVVTHAHSDHATRGHRTYLCAESGREVLDTRVGPDAPIEGIPFGEVRRIGAVTVSLHPAGHLVGSAQVRVEHRGEVWVVSGDYKTAPDRSCEAFEPVRCDTFITESTFGLPIYRWPAPEVTFGQINEWWRRNQEQGLTSVCFAYALGKAQRILGGVDPAIGPVLVHGSVAPFLPLYAKAGYALAPAEKATAELAKKHRGRALVVAPGSTQNTTWLRKFGDQSLAFASGWMRVRGARRRQALDRGFVLSDHADWPGLLDAIAATGASRIGVTHGFSPALARYLETERGLETFVVPTRFRGEAYDSDSEETEADASETEG